MIKDMIPLQI